MRLEKLIIDLSEKYAKFKNAVTFAKAFMLGTSLYLSSSLFLSFHTSDVYANEKSHHEKKSQMQISNQSSFVYLAQPEVSSVEVQSISNICSNTCLYSAYLMESFPNSFKNAKVTKYSFENARFVLIHIRQVHTSPLLSMTNIVEKVQNEIYDIICEMNSRGFVNVTYNEGFVQNEVDLIVTDVLSYKQDSENYMLLDEEQKKFYNLAEKSFLWLCRTDGAFRAFFFNGIPYKSAEENSLINKIGTEIIFFSKALKNVDSGNYSDNDWNLVYSVLDAREDYVLHLASQQENQIFVVVYGGLHDWLGGYKGIKYKDGKRGSIKDNIPEWNRKNKDKIFSLIEITPNSYPIEKE